ncbi:DUF3515 family protein [Streptomyces sp. B-S-A8]|uniref:DUF3515 family protein n=1 Tax=Streptomyces solicavernae TaxID=3043614 RepID=A0ABT6RQM7_9ACTN|nr:DUF3515 family protein [Streptomyces sp. B-S-A8]MDI3386514.1 DUF3515 family protein [Streptomyces sp. B-S-A8]
MRPSRSPIPRAFRALGPAPVWIAVSGVGVAAAIAYVSLSGGPEPAPNGASAACGEVVDRSPGEILGSERTSAGSEGTVQWGDGLITLRCGVKEPEPTVNLCVHVEEVDWVLDEGRLNRDGVSRMTTYGRAPAVEVTFSGPKEEAVGAVAELSGAVSWIEQGAKCVGAGDVS